MKANRGLRRINLNHLHYFWSVARLGSVTAAAKELRVSQPTVSVQLRRLERSIGDPLFERAGRGLRLTEAGQVVFRYAEEMFRLGGDMIEALDGRSPARAHRVNVGVVDSVPKLVVRSILEPLWNLDPPVTFVCREWRADILLAELALHRLDMVITDSSMPPGLEGTTVSQAMGNSPIGFYATRSLASRWRGRFPKGLNGAPFVMPAENTALRHSVDRWLDAHGLSPAVVAEAEDRALLNYFGQAGLGVFPAARVIEKEVCRQFNVVPVGYPKGVTEQYFVVCIKRRLRHPAVAAVCARARRQFVSARGGA